MKKKFTKLVSLSFFFLGLLILFPNLGSAQAGPSPRGSIPQIHVINLTVPVSNVSSGGEISGTFTLFNNSANNAPDVSYSAILVGDYKNGQPTVVYDEQKLGTTYLATGEKKTASFTYKLPATVAGNDLAIRIQVIYAGFYLGWDDARIIVKGKTSLVDIDSTEILIAGVSYGPEIGGVVPKDKTVTFRVNFTNKNSEDVTFTPNIKIYDRISTGQLLDEFKSVVVTIEAGKSKTATINLPVFNYKPLVYAGEVEFLDNLGQPKANVATFRYMILGDMASIQTATSESQNGNVGDVVNVDILYGGAPMDPNTGSIGKVGDVDFKVTLYDGAGNKVGESNIKHNIDEFGNKITVPVTLTANASELKVVATIEKGGTILAKDINVLTDVKKVNTSNAEPMKFSSLFGILIGLVIVAFVAAILASVVLKMRKSKSQLINKPMSAENINKNGNNRTSPTPPGTGGIIALFILLSASLFGILPGSASAYVETYVKTMSDPVLYPQEYPALFINTPYDNQVLRPGEQFNIDGRQDFWNCTNESRFDSTIKIGFNGATTTHTFSHELEGTGSITTNTFNYGPFTAPLTPGTYRIFFRADTRAYGIDWVNGGVDLNVFWDGASEGYVDIVVAGQPLPPIVITPTTGTSSGPACNASVNLSWNSIESGATYTLTRSDFAGVLYVGSSLSFVDTGLSPGTTYTYTVVGTSNQDGSSVTSQPVSIVAKCSPITASIVGSPNPVLTGQVVNWNVSVSGGNPPYAYVITGTDGLSVSNSSSLLNFGTTKTYSTAGTKTASVTITSADGQVKTVSATVPVTVNTALSGVSCSVSPTTVIVGQPVTWSCTPNPAGNYTYSWSGDDALSGSTLTIVKQYSSVGTKTASFDIVGQGSTPDWTGTVNVSVNPTFQPI